MIHRLYRRRARDGLMCSWSRNFAPHRRTSQLRPVCGAGDKLRRYVTITP
jgi:hypothetical protein